MATEFGEISNIDPEPRSNELLGECRRRVFLNLCFYPENLYIIYLRDQTMTLSVDLKDIRKECGTLQREKSVQKQEVKNGPISI